MTNIGTVVGTPVDENGDPLGLPDVEDSDPANYIVVGGPAIDIEKYVAVDGYTPAVELICETLGKPLSMTFDYETGTTVDTDQASDKAYIDYQGVADDDGRSFVIVTDKSNSTDLGGKVFFQGYVDVGSEFTAEVNADATSFGSSTWVHFFDDNPFDGGTAATADDDLLQSLTYHTSCSQPINLGDVVGNVALVGYTGENGTIDPNVWYGEDADDAFTAPNAEIGTEVTFNYVVTNPGSSSIGDVALSDDRLGDPAPVLEGGFNVGDTDGDGLLDPGEKWLYIASETAEAGLVANEATVTGIATDDLGVALPGLPGLSDSDMAHYLGVAELFPTYDICDELGKPKQMEWTYGPTSTIETSQGDKAKFIYDSGLIDDDGSSYILITSKDGATDLGGKEYFMGEVSFGESLLSGLGAAFWGADKFENDTRIHIWDDNPFAAGGLPADSQGLLQSMKYHTSCSQPIFFEDQMAGLTLTGYQGEFGEWGIG